MNTDSLFAPPRFRFKARFVLPAWLALTVTLAVAAPNNWTNSGSALWRSGTNWSLASAPTSASNLDPTQITNAGTKTITIDAATAANNLSLRSLTLSAPPGATNTLALRNVAPPLATSRALLVGNRGTLALTNSSISAGADFDIVRGAVILDSGALTCSLNCDVQSGSLLLNGGTLNAIAGTTGLRLGRFSGAVAEVTLNGGTLNASRVTLGSISGSQAALTLAGGSLISADSLSVAQLPATSASLVLTAGNLIVTNGTAKIADRAAASVTQSGGQALFADLSIGDLGVGTYHLNGGTFTVTPRTTNDFTIIGNLENGEFNQSGGVVVIRNELHVADWDTVTASVNILGGQFFATNDLVAIGRQGAGAMTVSNATVVLTNTSVGRHLASVGTLNVAADASVSLIADLSIGRLPGSSGQVFVSGGLLSVTNDEIWVGRGGDGVLGLSGGAVLAKNLHVGNSDDGTNAPTGTLTVAGGSAVLWNGFFLGTSGLSTGVASFTGGTVFVTNAAGAATTVIASGSFGLAGGTFVTDQMVATNNDGQFLFSSGVLRARGMTIANGQPFTVGDGVNPAMLELQGGTYSFADGLVIAPNATVTGCGTVIGSVVNHGAYSNTCGPASPPPTAISGLSLAAGGATLSCASQSGFTYTLEYKDSLSDAVWTTILPGLPGNGGALNLSDVTATNQARFYRVRVQ